MCVTDALTKSTVSSSKSSVTDALIWVVAVATNWWYNRKGYSYSKHEVAFSVQDVLENLFLFAHAISTVLQLHHTTSNYRWHKYWS